MNLNNPLLYSNEDIKAYSKKTIFVNVIDEANLSPASIEFIRFEEKKERYIWAHPDEIFFVKSADHYINTLIKRGKEKKWMSRHSTLKELLEILPGSNFIRLNKFYLLNMNYFSYINENEKKLYFNDDSFINIPHRISPFLRHLLKTTCT